MEYEIKYYYQVKYAPVCARQSFLKEPPKDDFEKFARRVIDRAYLDITPLLCYNERRKAVKKHQCGLTRIKISIY